ncbi:MAG TPA: polysaccharide deacetylase family protein [Rhodocyclaceae bacterium]|nr:polysaccharide deacetylase family protein [Rhodocyclaceae bacterium]
MPIRLRLCLAAALSLLPCVEVAAQSPGEHSPEEETTKTRQHHLKRLADRLTVDPAVLRQSCKYESDISTRPPAKRVALTFDDGPEPGRTEFILETLKKHEIKAAFFLIGRKAEQHPQLVAQIRAAGHHVAGSHSWDHPNFHDISVEEQAKEVLKSDGLLMGDQTLKLFRYPYGNSTCDTNNLLRTHGYRIVGWHVDSCDWAFDRTGSIDTKEAVSCGVLAQNRSDFVGHVVSSVRGHNGGIVLLHEIHPNTLKRLDEIIVKLKEDGFVFGSIDEPEFAPSLR